MENKKGSFVRRNWPWTGMLLILLAVAPELLGARLQTPALQFAYGVWIGLVIVFFMVFVYSAGKEYLGKSH